MFCFGGWGIRYCSRSYPKVGSDGSVICNWCLHEEDLMVMSGHDSTPQDNAMVTNDTPEVINDSISDLNHREARLNYSNPPRSMITQDLGKLDSNCSPRSSTNRPQSGTSCQHLIITKCPDLRSSSSPQSSINGPKLSISSPRLSMNRPRDLCHTGSEVACTQSIVINQPQSRRSSGGLDPSQDCKRPQSSMSCGNQGGLGNANCPQLTTNHSQLATNHPHRRRRIEPKEAIMRRSNHSKAFDYLLMIIAESFPEEKSESNNNQNNISSSGNHHQNDIILEQRIISREGGFMRAAERGKNFNNLKKSYSMKSTVTNKLGISDHLKYNRKRGVHELSPPVKANYRRYKLLADVLC